MLIARISNGVNGQFFTHFHLFVGEKNDLSD
jgi:hypothetical protein